MEDEFGCFFAFLVTYATYQRANLWVNAGVCITSFCGSARVVLHSFSLHGERDSVNPVLMGSDFGFCCLRCMGQTRPRTLLFSDLRAHGSADVAQNSGRERIYESF